MHARLHAITVGMETLKEKYPLLFSLHVACRYYTYNYNTIICIYLERIEKQGYNYYETGFTDCGYLVVVIVNRI